MAKGFFLFILTGLCLPLFAQLRNPSFEISDSTGHISNWRCSQGSISRLSAVSFGAIPFTAFDGNYFTVLESDTQTSAVKAGWIEQHFLLSDTPKSINIPNLFIPENTSQHARLQLLFTKWNGSSQDTVLILSDTLPIISEGNSIPIRWNNYSKNLTSFYRSSQVPDSALITLTNDDSNTGKTVRLYLDQIVLGRWQVGVKEVQKLAFHIFPNPATSEIIIQTPANINIEDLSVTNLSGQVILSQQLSRAGNRYMLITEEFPPGLYMLRLQTSEGTGQQLIAIQH